jgi:hypothetical protein
MAMMAVLYKQEVNMPTSIVEGKRMVWRKKRSKSPSLEYERKNETLRGTTKTEKRQTRRETEAAL